MKSVFTFLLVLLLASISHGQYVTEVFMPQYLQNSVPQSKVPFACRLTIHGLLPNATYRYFHRFVAEADTVSTATTLGAGTHILVNSTTGVFKRVTSTTNMNIPASYDTFTSDASGTYTGWFMAEPSTSATTFPVGGKVFVRIYLNDGGTGTTVAKRIAAPSPITIITFNSTPYYVHPVTGVNTPNGTAIRSTAATAGTAKNFVMLYDNAAGTGRPVTGTVIESDEVAGTLANSYALFYNDNVNAVNKTWGTIIPNTLANGIKRIAQYSLTTGAETGFRTSSSGSWAKEGGGTVSTINTTGGTTNIIVIDGSVVKLDIPILLPQTITFNALPGKTYGDPDFAPGATINTSLPITYTSSNTAVATIVNGMVHITGAGTTDITAIQDGDDDYAVAPPVTQTLTVNKKTLTVTAQDVTVLQNDPMPSFTVSYNGFVNGDDETDLATIPTATTTVSNSSVPGAYPITAANGVSSNYVFDYVSGTLTVAGIRQTQTLSFDPLPAKTYGDPDFDAGATASSNLAVTYTSSDPSVASINAAGSIHITGAGTTTITASQDGNNAFFPATPVSQLLKVDFAQLTITADDQSRLVGQPNPTLTVSYSGFVYAENSTVLSSAPVTSTTATTASAVGDYPITVDGASAANYTITYVNGRLAILPLPSQTISFNPFPVKRYGNPDFAASATASSGLPVSYSSSNLQVATVNNGIIHIVGAGTTGITASQPGDPFHAAAQPITNTLTVQKANLGIYAVDTSKNEGQPNPVFRVSYNGFVNGDDAGDLTTQPDVISTATTSSLTGNYPIIASGASSPNYSIAFVDGTLSVLPANGVDQRAVSAYMSAPGKLRVNYHARIAGSVNVQLFDSYANRLLNVTLFANKGINTWYFEAGNLAAGIYPVRIAGNEVLVKTKVIIR